MSCYDASMSWFSRGCIFLSLIAVGLTAVSGATDQAQHNYREFTLGKNGFIFEKLNAIQTWDDTRSQIAVRLDQQIDVIKAIHDTLEARGTKLVIALVPMVHRIYVAQLPGRFKLPSMVPGSYRTVINRLNRLGVLTPDIESAYLGYAKHDQLRAPLFLRADHHWSPNGGLEAARIVANAIQKRYGPEIAAMPQVKYDLKFRDAKRYVEYASFFRAMPPRERTGIQPDLIRIPEFSLKTGGDSQTGSDLGLLTDTTPKITVVGTSFSSIQVFGFAASIAQRLSRDVLNAAQSGKEAWTPMGEYLASDTFQDHPPSIIVWEIPQSFLMIGMQPVHNSTDWNARQYLLELGANLRGDCGIGTSPIATHGNGFVLQGSNASSTSTRAASFVKYQFVAPIRADQYLSVHAGSSTSDSFVVEGEGGNPPRYYAKLPSYGGMHLVNVPLAMLVDGKAHSVKIRIAPGSNLSIERPLLCTMPAKIAVLAGTSY
jgi:alginate O-acetyltransferase complex protein AlgJ